VNAKSQRSEDVKCVSIRPPIMMNTADHIIWTTAMVWRVPTGGRKMTSAIGSVDPRQTECADVSGSRGQRPV
jgi:hypothetical protein